MKSMGMNSENCVMSGMWTGRFYRDQGGSDGVHFSANLTLENGRIAGTVLEPNTFADVQKDDLDATIRGHVHQSHIELLKTYRDLDQEPVYCEGQISDDGQRIVGKWYFDWPNEISGTFEMQRNSAPLKAFQSQAETARR